MVPPFAKNKIEDPSVEGGEIYVVGIAVKVDAEDR